MTPDHHLPASAPDIPSRCLQSYPGHLSRTWTLPSGQSLCVRPVRHDDGELEEAFVRGLSLESAYQRMLSGGTKVTPEWIESMTHIDYDRHMAFAITTVRDGVEQFVGVARYVVDPAALRAEVAIVVGDAWQAKVSAAGCWRRCSSMPRVQAYRKQSASFSPPTGRCYGLPVRWALPRALSRETPPYR